MQSKMEKVAELLGVKLGQQFKIVAGVEKEEVGVYSINTYDFIKHYSDGDRVYNGNGDVLVKLLAGDVEIDRGNKNAV